MLVSSIERVKVLSASNTPCLMMDDTILPNGTNDLLCAVCYSKEDREEGAIGICKVCKYYLCGPCTIAHQHHPDTRRHQMAFFYCAQKLKANRYVRADSFCLDCGQYLCTKCVLDHGGFWRYRHHTFIGRRSQTLTEIPLNYKHSHSPKTHRRPMTKSTQRSSQSSEKEGRKSPYTLPDIIPKQPEKATKKPRRNAKVSEKKIEIPRTLVHSSIGRQANFPDKTQFDNKSTKNKRPKSVHYKDDQHISEASLIGEYSVKSVEDTQPCRIVASVYLNNDSLVVADTANKNIKLFDKNYHCAATMKMDSLPLAVCASHLGQTDMFASSGSCVYHLDTNRGFQINNSFDTHIPRIEGITTWTDGIAAIFKSARSKADTKGHWEVHLMNCEGSVKFEIAISTPMKVKLVTPIWYISCSDTGKEIFISDTHNNRILCIDVIKWHVVFVIKGRDASGAPRSLATDASGNVLVTWYDGVHNISQTGADLGVPVPNVSANSVISYNKKNMKLAVWSENKTQGDRFSLYQLKR